FVFLNSQQSSTTSYKGACVDNILIAPAGSCSQPKDLAIASGDGSSLIFSWSGNASAYEVKYYSRKTGEWVYPGVVSSTSTTFSNMDDGVYEFYVRAVCGEYNSPWQNMEKLINLSALKCIDFLDLNNDNCYYGSSTRPRGLKGKMDFGPSNMYSRHTVHTDHTETDPRTGDRLHTIPPGEIASVRLGNWHNQGQGESIEYTYTVDSTKAAVLMMKYAVVLEEPVPKHDSEKQPRFNLEILDGNSNLINCAQAEFRAAEGLGSDTTWHRDVTTNPKRPVWWKSWTTIGVNMKDYHGKTLTIRVSTRDCGEVAHFGYAYFTLSCSNGQMEGLSCGDTPTNEFKAPEGFKYRWYLADGKHLSSNQTFPVTSDDTRTYFCDLMFPQDTTCYFTLTASAKPRYPIVEATFEKSVVDCKNVVKFTNTSHIMLVDDDGKEVHTDTPVDKVLWDFGDGTTAETYSPTHEFPAEGGTFNVTLKATLATCDTTMKWSIDLPYLDPADYEVERTICTGQSYFFDGEYRTESGTYIGKAQSSNECDSILHLTVIEAVQIDLPEKDFVVCEGVNNIAVNYSAIAGNISLYRLNFTPEAIKAGFENKEDVAQNPIIISMPDSVLPGTYPIELIFFDEDCGNITTTLNLDILYSSKIFRQRWNDILAISNIDNNGGYDFSNFQWYVNGEKIEGETKSYIYVSTGLKPDDTYTAELTRSDDQIAQFTCGFNPLELISSLELVNSTVQANEKYSIESTESGTVRVYTLSGILINEYKLAEGSNQLNAPSNAGYYILQVKTSNEEKTYHLQVTQ
ncbi:T9SS type A sorting domain-containing protein, partial [Paludibacteraceae bacterium OttesenSCG-928-F17]|nr:T9SS type A sorting domain-containing protein [Paludibacteraceae bacterium OttesenSCG-928-F17]